MAVKKTTVGLSAQVNVKGSTLTDLVEAAKFVGAPDSATVSITNVGTVYVPPNPDGTPAEPVEQFPFSVTFSWSEEK